VAGIVIKGWRQDAEGALRVQGKQSTTEKVRDPFSVRYELARFLPIKKRGKDHDTLTPPASHD